MARRERFARPGACHVLNPCMQRIECEILDVDVYVNGEPRRLPAGVTVAQLLDELALTGQRLAVEVNLEIVPRSAHAAHTLRTGDRVEIVRAIGGG